MGHSRPGRASNKSGYVRFAPKATEAPHCSEMKRRAMKRHTHDIDQISLGKLPPSSTMFCPVHPKGQLSSSWIYLVKSAWGYLHFTCRRREAAGPTVVKAAMFAIRFMRASRDLSCFVINHMTDCRLIAGGCQPQLSSQRGAMSGPQPPDRSIAAMRQTRRIRR